MPNSPFTLRMRVRYAECDAQQVVFNSRYGDYADLAATEFFRELFGGYQQIIERELDTQVVNLTINWQDSARFDDVLAIEVVTSRLGTSSYTLSMQVIRDADKKQLATVDVVYVMVNTRDWQKTPIPQDVRMCLEKGAPGVVCNQAG